MIPTLVAQGRDPGTSKIDLNPTQQCFITDRSNTVVLLLFVICRSLWLLPAGIFMCFILCCVLGQKGVGYFVL